MYTLPLDYSYVVEFESVITNCSKKIELVVMPDPPSGERYLDSTLVRFHNFVIFSLPKWKKKILIISANSFEGADNQMSTNCDQTLE